MTGLPIQTMETPQDPERIGAAAVPSLRSALVQKTSNVSKLWPCKTLENKCRPTAQALGNLPPK